MKSRRRFGLPGATLFLAAAALPALAASPREERLLLWEVRSPTATVHLLGSIHLAKPDLYPLDPAIDAAFDRAAVLLVEVNMNEVDPAALQGKFLEAGTLPAETPLAEVLSPDTLAKLKALLEARGLPLEAFAVMRPWLLAVTLGVMELQRLGYDPAQGIDLHYLQRAAEGGKRVEGLESVDFQLRLLSDLSWEMQDKFLLYTLRDLERLPGLVDGIFTAWRSGDAATLERALLDPEERSGPLKPVYDRLFFERNVAMAARIEGYLAGDVPVFAVVGAGHLVGKGGIIDLLQDGGEARYRIRQVAPAGAAPEETASPAPAEETSPPSP